MPKPEPKVITDGDVLSSLIEKGTVAKDAIVTALAGHEHAKNLEADAKLAAAKEAYLASLAKPEEPAAEPEPAAEEPAAA